MDGQLDFSKRQAYIATGPSYMVQVLLCQTLTGLSEKAHVWGLVQMIACASLALDVLSRNLRSFSFVSGEKEYRRESDCERLAPVKGIREYAWPRKVNLARGDVSPFWKSSDNAKKQTKDGYLALLRCALD
jgi:hypothetical protein